MSVLVAVMWAIPHVARACSCLMPKPPLEALAESDAVFEARVVDRRDPEDDGGIEKVLYDLQVAQVWKGELGEQVTITTAKSSAACGRSYGIGEAYLIYAYTAQGALSDGLCTRTRPLADAGEDLAALGPGRPPGSQSPAQGPGDAREPPRIEPTPEPPATAEPRGCGVAGEAPGPALALVLALAAVGAPHRRRRGGR